MDFIEELELWKAEGVLTWADGGFSQRHDERQHVAEILASAIAAQDAVQSYSAENEDLRARVAWLEQRLADLGGGK